MIPISDNPPPGVVDRRDGSTIGECGITTIGNLFCKDQIANSKSFVKRYGEITWSDKGGCQVATCPHWNKPTCWLTIKPKRLDPKKHCPVYLRRQKTGRW
jgi:hypothetical protein